MPVDEEGKVHFKSTLFSLIRINLQIFMRSMEEMDQADQELRTAIQRSWPQTRAGMVDLLVPPPEGESSSSEFPFLVPYLYGEKLFKLSMVYFTFKM